MKIEKINSIYSNLKRFSSKPSNINVQKGEWALRQVLPPIPEPINVDIIHIERHYLQEISSEFNERIFKLAELKGLLEKEPNKDRIPRFLYHLTTQEAYNTMIEKGYLEPRFDTFCDKQIFMFDIKNFSKQWKKEIYNYNFDLQKKLLRWIARKTSSNLILLRIPTDNIDKNVLRTRSQEVLFSNSKIIATEQDNLLKKYNCEKLDELLEKAEKDDLIFLELFDWYKRLIHLTKGAPAGMNKLFTQRKDAVEYFYPNKIDISQINCIGKIPSTKITKEEFSLQETIIEILKDQSEIKNFINF